MSLIFDKSWRYFSTKRPRLQSGPVATIRSGSGAFRSVSARKSTAWSGSTAFVAAGRYGEPSSPLGPSAVPSTSGRASGRRQPAATGTSAAPMNCKTRRAFETVLSISALPQVTVTPTRSIAGERCAMTIAIASSWPGSQSKRIGVGRTAGACAVVMPLSSRGRGGIAGDGLLEDPHEAAPVDVRADLSRLRSVGGQELTAAIGDRLPARDSTVEDDVDEKRLRHLAEGGFEGQGDGNDVVHRKANQVEKLSPDIDVDRESILDHR